MIFHDRLYGQMEFGKKFYRLFQTKELGRLRHISLSAVPIWTLPTSTCASKFEHSLGVAYLAKILIKEQQAFAEFTGNLFLAALLHDIGTPPFSHAAEYFQIKVCGKNHEEFAADILDGSDLAREVKRQGGDPDRIIRYINGKGRPIGDLINSSIDLDNIDNSLRYGISMGLLESKTYSPFELVRSFELRDRDIRMKMADLEPVRGWEKCREQVYSFVYSRYNLAPGMMLFRALGFAREEGELSIEFFLLDDREAAIYLRKKCNPRTAKLLADMENWRFYKLVYEWETIDPTPEQRKTLEEHDNRLDFSNRLSKHLGIKPQNISVYLGSNKAYKEIHFPLVDKKGQQLNYTPQLQNIWRAQVYLDPDNLDKKEDVKEWMDEVMQ